MPKPDDTDDDLELAPLVVDDDDNNNNNNNHHDGSKNNGLDYDDPNEKEPTPLKGSLMRLLTTSNNWKSITACALYSFCSVSMILVNKSLASSYNHYLGDNGDLNTLLVVIQAIVAVICVEACKRFQVIEPYPDLTWETAKAWAPVNLFFCAMLFTGMASLQYNSVPMVTVFKNVTNIVTSIGDYVFFGSKSEGLVVVAFGIMLGGAMLAAWKDIEVTFAGLFWMVMNCLSTSGYVLYMKFATNNVKLSTFGMVFVNNVLCVVFLFPVALLNGELTLFFKTQALHTFDYFSKNSFAGFVGFFLNFASLNCVAATGPTTYAIVGSLNKIPVAILGYLLFDNIISGETWFFISVSMCGGFLYSYAKLQSSSSKPQGSRTEGTKS